MMKNRASRLFTLLLLALFALSVNSNYVNSQGLVTDIIEDDLQASMIDMPVVKLRSLDKITARTKVFEANVGSTVKFGSLYIRVQACRKAPPIEQPESAAFLQVWQLDKQEEPVWVFSGWMFASSPGLSSMDHPIYDVWVLDCSDTAKPAAAEDVVEEGAAVSEESLSETEAPE